MIENTQSIFNFCQTSDRISIGGQPAIDQFKLLKDADNDVIFQVVVKEATYSVKNEAYHVDQLGLEHRIMHISLTDPTVANVQTFFEIMDDYSNKKIFVHCAAGYCTSGLMVIYLMQHQNMTFEQAKSNIIAWEPTPVWKQLIHDITGFNPTT